MKKSTSIEGTTAQQKLFAYAYINNKGNAKQAAIEAGYSSKTAEQQASRLLSKVKVKNLISKLQDKLEKKSLLSQEMVLEGYRRLAFYDARKFYGENGNLISVPDLDDETAFALSGFEVTEEKDSDGKGNIVVVGYTKKIKMSDRRSALDSICKVLGYNAAEKKDVTINNFLNFLKASSSEGE